MASQVPVALAVQLVVMMDRKFYPADHRQARTRTKYPRRTVEEVD